MVVIDRERDIWKSMRMYYPGMAHRIEAAGRSGIPDVQWIYRGRSGWLELKYNVSRVLPAQALFLRRWGFHGGSAFVLGYYFNRFRLVPYSSIGRDRGINWVDSQWTSPELTREGWREIAEIMAFGEVRVDPASDP